MYVKIFCVLLCLGSVTFRNYCGEPATPAKITEITLTRTGDGKGSGPEDILTLRSDGSAVYVGRKNVERIGTFSGTIPFDGFASSFTLLTQRYESLRSQSYSTGKPSGLTEITCTVVRGGKNEEINDLCPGLDPTLWAFEMTVRGVAGDIQWKKAAPARDKQSMKG